MWFYKCLHSSTDICMYMLLPFTSHKSTRTHTHTNTHQTHNTHTHTQTHTYTHKLRLCVLQVRLPITYIVHYINVRARKHYWFLKKKELHPTSFSFHVLLFFPRQLLELCCSFFYIRLLLLSDMRSWFQSLLPHTLFTSLQKKIINIPADQRDKFIKEACRQLNSTLGATFGLLYPPEVIACCMITRAARVLDSTLPKPKKEDHGKTWINAVLLSEKVPLLLHGETRAFRPTLLPACLSLLSPLVYINGLFFLH